MTHDRDKILLRAKDISLLILVLSFFGMLIGPLKKIFQLEDTINKVASLENRAMEDEKAIAIINSQYVQISKQLDQISWQLRRMSR